MIGVSVLVQGTTTGTVTDLDGKFTLEVPANATLVVSYIGYKTQNVKSVLMIIYRLFGEMQLLVAMHIVYHSKNCMASVIILVVIQEV